MSAKRPSVGGHRGYRVSGAVSRQQRLQKLFKKGLKHHREGHGELAEACYRKILNVDPLSSEAKQMSRLLQGTAGAGQESSPTSGAIFGDDTTTPPESAESSASWRSARAGRRSAGCCEFLPARSCSRAGFPGVALPPGEGFVSRWGTATGCRVVPARSGA
jgi:hypothetical protein